MDGWSAVTAGILAVGYGAVGGLLVIAGGLQLLAADRIDPVGVVALAVLAVMTLLLLIGAVLLLAGRAAGRWSIAAGTVLTIGVLGYVLLRSSLAVDGITRELAAAGVDQVRRISIAALVLAVVMLVLTLLPSTGRWTKTVP